MKDKHILVASHIGVGRTTVIAEVLAHKHHNDVIIMTPERAKQEAMFPKSEPIVYKTNPPLPQIFEGKKLVCKGKHQYREVKEKDGSLIKVRWVCQCGKSL